ncbi:MAG: phosphoenolpyruvate synthase [Bdellovibrionales bacterium]
MIVTPKSTLSFSRRESGGKGHNLYLMSQAGLPVPAWVVFGKRFFQEFIATHNLKSELERTLESFREARITGAECEKAIDALFESKPATPFLKSHLDQALKILPAGEFSVRSSAADEDGSSHSFAGQLSSFLYVKEPEEILKFIKKCWSSGFSERGLVYRKTQGLDLSKISISVVLQKMIDPEKSGVLFTCDPVSQKTDTFTVSSVYGVGEGLVSGLLSADSFWLEMSSGKVLRSEVVEKLNQVGRSRSHQGHCQTTEIESSKVHQASLGEGELSQLWILGRKIQDHFHRPQDIEWAIVGGELYVLQTRPVTNLQNDLVGYPNLWDNSNIVESYGGLTSPLSYSFALRNYRAVYVQFCEILGVPNQVIKEMDSYLSYMLGCIKGRVYYNLFNWYKLVGVLPGFKMNREFMETMMGVSEALSDEIEDRIQPHPSWKTFQGKIRRFISGFNFLVYHWTIQSIVDDFLSQFRTDYEKYRALPLTRMRGDQLMRVYSEIETRMLGRWKAPIINDFLCMVHFGLLRKLTLKWLGHLDSTLQNDLISEEGGLESAEPMKALQNLSELALQDPELKSMILTLEASDLLEALNQSRHQEFYREVLLYIEKYGFRCMSEMKLEEIDLSTDPSYLFVCLKNYLKAPRKEESEQSLRHVAEAKVRQHLTGLRRWIYFWVLMNARLAVKNRENTRFARTRIYGVARTIFQTIGEDLYREGALQHPRHIFYLTIEEVYGIYNGALPAADLNALAKTRKSQYEIYENEPAPDARVLTRGAVYIRNELIKPVEVANYEGEDFDLKGLPCCPGLIEGTVKLISSPSDNLELNGEILVADRTDPGWVPLYPSIRGLLVERGSLLSHSAIVAREMGIPTIVSIPGLTKKLKTGMKVRLDGKAGTIKILEEASS